MDIEFKVIDINSRPGLISRFSQTPRCDVYLNRDVISKMGLTEGEIVKVKGKRTTVGRVVPIDKNDFSMDAIGLNNLVRNNARVSPEEMITLLKTDSKVAKRIVLEPLEKHLKKSELIKGLVKTSFLNTPLMEGDVTYLRSKILGYLIGSITWLRVVKTEPSGVVIAGENTDFEIHPDPVVQTTDDQVYYLPDYNSDDDFSEKDLALNDTEWAKMNSLLEIGLFKNLYEAMTFFLREGIKYRSDIFQKTDSVIEQLKQLREAVTENPQEKPES